MRTVRRLAIQGAGRLLALRRRLLRPITLGVRVVLVRDGEVLLVRHTYMPGWFLPGGGLRRGETLAQAVLREAREEVGARITELRQLGAFSNFGEAMNDHIVVFASERFTLSPSDAAEIDETRFFRLEALPDETSAGTRTAVEQYLMQRDSSSG